MSSAPSTALTSGSPTSRPRKSRPSKREEPASHSAGPTRTPVPRDALPGQGQQHCAREHDAPGDAEVVKHPVGMHHHVPHDPCEPAEHVVQGDEAVGQDDALGRRVGDIALVPGDTFSIAATGCRAGPPGKPDDRLEPTGCACAASPRTRVWPRSNSSWISISPSFSGCADLEREVLSGAPVWPAPEPCACRSRWMIWDETGAGGQTQPPAHELLYRRVEIAVDPDRPGHLADRHRLRARQPSRSMSRSICEYRTASLNPNVIGSA